MKKQVLRTKNGFNKYNHSHNIAFLFGVKPVKIIFDDKIFHTFIIYIDSNAINSEARENMVIAYEKYFEIKIKTV